MCEHERAAKLAWGWFWEDIPHTFVLADSPFDTVAQWHSVLSNV